MPHPKGSQPRTAGVRTNRSTKRQTALTTEQKAAIVSAIANVGRFLEGWRW